jgi:alpha-tubulin suppressor-like RCC1 family protein
MSTTLQYFVAGQNEYRCLGLTDSEHEKYKTGVNCRASKKSEDEKTRSNRFTFDIWDRNIESNVITKKQQVHYASTSQKHNINVNSDNNNGIFDMANVEQVVCGSYFTYFRTSDGLVYACGENESGQLATGDTTSRNERPVLCQELVELGPIKNITAGFTFAIFQNYRGEVYGFGSNYYGQLCSAPTDNNTSAVHIDRSLNFSGENIEKVAAGSMHVAILTGDGRVWCAGANDEGQCGAGEPDDDDDEEEVLRISKPKQVMMGRNPVLASDVQCGRYHTVVLVKTTGDVIVFGSTKNGQCGTGTGTKISTPTLLKTPVNTYSRIWAKADSTFLLTIDGRLLGFGRGIEGNFGDGKLEKSQSSLDDMTDADQIESSEEESSALLAAASAADLKCSNLIVPTVLDAVLPCKPSDIKDIVQGGYCTFLLLKDNKTVFAAGGNRFGQLLLDSPEPNAKRFQKVELDPNFTTKLQKQSSQNLEVRVAAGETYSIMYFYDPEKATSATQWFGLYPGRTRFEDIEIICTRKHARSSGEDDEEPAAKRRRLELLQQQ